jgi:hypothetical protein
MFSKNRRGGSGVNKSLYYDLAEDGSVVYDEQRYRDTQEAREFSNNEAVRQQELNKAFESMFGIFEEDVVELERGE